MIKYKSLSTSHGDTKIVDIGCYLAIMFNTFTIHGFSQDYDAPP